MHKFYSTPVNDSDHKIHTLFENDINKRKIQN